MKIIQLFQAYQLARATPSFEEFEQLIKVELTDKPYTVAINETPVIGLLKTKP